MTRLWLIGAVAASITWACGESSVCAIDLGADIEQFTVDGYNNAVRQTGGGSAVNVTWSCTGGGSAQVTGTANTQTITYDLTWTFHACMDGTLTLDGVMQDHTVNGAQTSTKSETVHSDALKMYGTAIGCDANPIDATCVVDITDTTTSICGLTN